MRLQKTGALCVASALLAGLALACVGDEPATVSPGTGDGGDGDPQGEGGTQSGFTMALDPTSGSLRAGATATFKARVVRQAGAIGALALSVPTGLPAGVSVTSDGVLENASEATITLTALPSAAVGATKITVRAESFDHAFFQTATLDLEVRGASGTLDTTFGTGGIAAIAIAIPDAHEVERAAPAGGERHGDDERGAPSVLRFHFPRCYLGRHRPWGAPQGGQVNVSSNARHVAPWPPPVRRSPSA